MEAPQPARLTRWLSQQSTAVFASYAVFMSFVTYFCMYSFRKPFAVGTYDGQTFGDLDLKSALVIAQVCGYALSKFLGIRFNSELPHKARLLALVALIAFAEFALLIFAVVPSQWRVVAIFANGLPLGAVWGIVFSFLEGRRSSEILGAGLSCSYIVASGFVKTVGSEVGEWVSEAWMPVSTGALFLPAFLLSAYGLSLLPPPSPEDVEERTPRAPMNLQERKAFRARYALGLLFLVTVYLFQTAYRDIRDNYAADIWQELGMGQDSAVFTSTEIPIALAVLFALSLLYRIKDNRKALMAAYALMVVGSVLIGASTLAFDAGVIGPKTWMTGVGLGLYMGYVPYGCILFDRTIAALHTVATAVFLIYVSDAVAYGGSVAALLYKNFAAPGHSWLEFFRAFSYLVSVVTFVLLLASAWYFLRAARRAEQNQAGRANAD